MPDDEKRHPSDTIPIPIDEIRRLLGSHGDYHPEPDDETPTSPEIVLPDEACAECGGSGQSIEEKPGGGYRGPVVCPRCKGGKTEPRP